MKIRHKGSTAEKSKGQTKRLIKSDSLIRTIVEKSPDQIEKYILKNSTSEEDVRNMLVKLAQLVRYALDNQTRQN